MPVLTTEPTNATADPTSIGNIFSCDDGTQDSQRFRIPNDLQEFHRETTGIADGAGASEEKKSQTRADWFAKFVDQPFGVFIIEAYSFNRKHSEDRDEWLSPIFHFVWLLTGHKQMENFLNNGKKALQEVEACMRSWTMNVRREGQKPPFGFHGKDAWMEWFDIDRADARAEFLGLWPKIRFRPGNTPLKQAFDAARRMRLILPQQVRDQRPVAEPSERDEKDYEFFISVAGHLQVIVGDRQILLPCREISGLLNVSPMTVSRYRSWAIEDKYLSIVKPHSFRSKGRSDATEFRFDVSRYKCLATRARTEGTMQNFDLDIELERLRKA